MPVFTDTITLYNKYKADGKEHWQRRVVSGVHWTENQGAVARKTGVTPTNGLTLVIPQEALTDYVSPQAFAAMEDRAGVWTVAAHDTVVLGDVPVEITVTPGKDLAGQDHVRTVTMVDSLLHGHLAHLEVTGK